MPRGRGRGVDRGQQSETEGRANNEADEGGGTGVEDKDMAEPTIADMVIIFRTHMGQQQDREARWDQEAARQEKRFKTLQHLQVVFECLQVAGLTVNAAKCTFAKAETEYLGHVIGRGVIKPQVQKVQALQSCPLPQTRTQLKSFLGMSGWYHKFIPN